MNAFRIKDRLNFPFGISFHKTSTGSCKMWVLTRCSYWVWTPDVAGDPSARPCGGLEMWLDPACGFLSIGETAPLIHGWNIVHASDFRRNSPRSVFVEILTGFRKSKADREPGESLVQSTASFKSSLLRTRMVLLSHSIHTWHHVHNQTITAWCCSWTLCSV